MSPQLKLEAERLTATGSCALSEDQLEALARVLPSPDERKVLQAFTGDPAELEHVERCMLEVGREACSGMQRGLMRQMAWHGSRYVHDAGCLLAVEWPTLPAQAISRRNLSEAALSPSAER